jgi:hypothetical protein
MTLFALTVSPVALALWAALAVLGVFLGMRWFQRDEGREDRDRERNAVVRILEAAKMPRMADILECVVVRDWSGLLRECIGLRKEVKTEADLLRLMEANFWYQLEQRMKDDDQRPKIVQVVDDLKDVEDAKDARAEKALVDKLKAEGYEVKPPVKPPA